MKNKKFIDILAKRAQLSMIGNGFIGLVGGVVLLFLAFFKNNNDNTYIPTLGSYVEFFVLGPNLLDSNKRVSHLIKYSIDTTQVDSISSFLFSSLNHGKIIKEINNNDLDSFYTLHKSIIKKDSHNVNYFYIKSLKSTDFILGIKDSLIYEISPVYTAHPNL